MSIFLNEHSKVIVQGITGAEATKHTTKMLAAGTDIVGGVNARKAGQQVSIGGRDLTVFGTVEHAIKETGADVSIIFVPPRFARDAVLEAIDAEIGLAVVITEGIPVHDAAYFWAHACAKGTESATPGAPRTPRTRIIGPNCPGIISPGKSNAGIIPADIAGPGRIGLVSKSGTLTYQMMYELRDIGFSSA
ncbi:MAG: succinyl-CoA synthetase alpha subunit, partial [Pseudonocardiales bacterium]|nr:succinyl-CoA synthetase alpha subunit [Pseudonocardiales bacterium]